MTILPTLIQSVAQSPRRDVTQPAGEAHSSRRTLLAAPLPNPHVSTSHSCGTSAMSAVTRVPPLSIEPDDGERIVWAPLAILAAALASWVPILLAGKWAWGVFI